MIFVTKRDAKLMLNFFGGQFELKFVAAAINIENLKQKGNKESKYFRISQENLVGLLNGCYPSLSRPPFRFSRLNTVAANF